MLVQPYLFFNGRCEEAISFYRDTLGAEVVAIMRYKDNPHSPPPGMVPEGWGDKIMHSSLNIGGSNVMASDRPQSAEPGFAGFSLSLSLEDEGKGAKIFAALAEAGQVRMPFEKTFFAKRFGVVADKFGVGWMIHVAS